MERYHISVPVTLGIYVQLIGKRWTQSGKQPRLDEKFLTANRQAFYVFVREQDHRTVMTKRVYHFLIAV